MNYRECRIITLFEIFKLANKEVDLRKIFLVLGGLKNYVYKMKNKSIDVFFPSGFTDISCHNIFERFHIEYEAIKISEFLNKYSYFKNENKMIIMPFSSDILGVRSLKSIDLTMFGQSYLPIKNINFKDKKIFFETNEDYKDFWIDIDICLELDSKDFKLLDGLKVYIIDKLEVEKNTELAKCFNQDYISLLSEVVNEFEVNGTSEFEDGLLRISGVSAYDYIIQQFMYIKKFYHETENKVSAPTSQEITEKLQQSINIAQKYLFMEIRYFRQFILAGTDAYYRNEFMDVLSYINEIHNLELESNIEKWKKIARKWRSLGRKLSELYNRKSNNREYFYYCLEYLINAFKEIKELECGAIKELKCKINKASKGVA